MLLLRRYFLIIIEEMILFDRFKDNMEEFVLYINKDKEYLLDMDLNKMVLWKSYYCETKYNRVPQLKHAVVF